MHFGITSMEPLNLKFLKPKVESLHELLKDIATLTHQLLCLLLSQNTHFVNFWSLKVWEYQDKYLLIIPRYFHQVHLPLYFMEVPI